MRVVHLTGWFFPDSLGGTENYVDALAREQVRAGHDVHIVAPRAGADSTNEYLHSDIPVFRYPTPAKATRPEARGAIHVRGTEHLFSHLRALRPDVVHVHSITTGLGVREIEQLRESARAIVVTHHTSGLGYLCQRGSMMQYGRELCDGICEPIKCASCELQHRGVPIPLARAVSAASAVASGTLGSAPGRLGTLLGMPNVIRDNQAKQRRLADAVDQIVVLTQWAAGALLQSGIPQTKLSINRLGIASGIGRRSRTHSSRVGRSIRVGYLGRFEAIKGPQILIAAVSQLPRDLDIEVELRGPVTTADEMEFVDRLRSATGNDTRIRFAPAVPAPEVAEVLATYDVLCCPSLCLEGGPTVALEAQSLGIPVVGARIGGLAEIVTDGVDGRLFPPGDAQMLAGILREIVQSPVKTVERWSRAQPPVRTVSAIAADYEQTYASVLGLSKWPNASGMV